MFSFYTSWGDYKGWKIFKDGPSRRIYMGRLSICVSPFDVEKVFENILIDNKKYDSVKDAIEKDRLEIEKEKNEIVELKKKVELDRGAVHKLENKVRFLEQDKIDLAEEVKLLEKDIEISKDLEDDKNSLEREVEELEDKLENLENINTILGTIVNSERLDD